MKRRAMARDIGLQAGLKFVYEGNVPGEGGVMNVKRIRRDREN
ncbi:cytoplasmic protein [Syntrophus aciditrophicus]|uniref:Hypothetical cytosolic protein n=1 Tax=Syntrophus aciditrophicus (strain SB) TaxID=56780 RepID=Q2LQY2_SYNAS|nr:cytoplasmic protein [Syntrophus aciditrophicus]ABC76495.1 hypothetical cytosolic protein [Syntrophus aciditrophicus SB]